MCRLEVLLSAVSAEVQVSVGSFLPAVPAKVQVLPEMLLPAALAKVQVLVGSLLPAAPATVQVSVGSFLPAALAKVQVWVGSLLPAVSAEVQVLPEVLRVLLFAAAAKADYTSAVTEQAQRSRVTERQRVFLLMPQEVSVLFGRSALRCFPAERMPQLPQGREIVRFFGRMPEGWLRPHRPLPLGVAAADDRKEHFVFPDAAEVRKLPPHFHRVRRSEDIQGICRRHRNER